VVFPVTPVSSTNKTDCNIVESGVKHHKPNIYSPSFYLQWQCNTWYVKSYLSYRIVNFRGSFINVSTVSPTQEVTFTVSITTPVGQHNITLDLASGFDGLPVFHICSIEDSILFGENIINPDYTIIKTSTFDNYQVRKNK